MPKKKLNIGILPEELVLPLLGSIRTIERTLNPAFKVVLTCQNCGGWAKTVPSKKKKGQYIGIQCTGEDCGQTIKFEKPLDFRSASMPERLRDMPDSALIYEGYDKPKVSKEWVKEVFEIMMDGLDE